MASKLTHKEKGFVQDYAAGKTGVQAALDNYDTDSYNTAAAIASENLRKPKIIQALGLDDESLQKKHVQLLNQKRLDYFVFPKSFDDEEIARIVEEDTGIVVINIRETDKGKMAWYATDDAQTQDKALDKAYRLTGKYAAEKHMNLNVNAEVEASPELHEAARILDEHFKALGRASDGAEARPLDSQA